MADNNAIVTKKPIPPVGFSKSEQSIQAKEAIKMLEALNKVIAALEVIGDDLTNYSTYGDDVNSNFDEQFCSFFTPSDIYDLEDKFIMFRACYLSKAVDYDALLENWKNIIEEEIN